MTPIETTLIGFFTAAVAGGGVKIFEKRNAVSPEECRKNHEREDKKIDRLENKINDQTKMIRSLVTHTITDSDKQEQILNKNGGGKSYL